MTCYGSATKPQQCATISAMDSNVENEEVSCGSRLFLSQSISSKQDWKLLAQKLELPQNEIDRKAYLVNPHYNVLVKWTIYQGKAATYGHLQSALRSAIEESDSRDLKCAEIEFELYLRHTLEEKKCGTRK